MDAVLLATYIMQRIELRHCTVLHKVMNLSVCWGGVFALQNCLQMGTLSEERVVKLNEIGFTCEVRRSPKRSGIDFVFTSCFCLSMVVQEIY